MSDHTPIRPEFWGVPLGLADVGSTWSDDPKLIIRAIIFEVTLIIWPRYLNVIDGQKDELQLRDEDHIMQLYAKLIFVPNFYENMHDFRSPLFYFMKRRLRPCSSGGRRWQCDNQWNCSTKYLI